MTDELVVAGLAGRLKFGSTLRSSVDSWREGVQTLAALENIPVLIRG